MERHKVIPAAYVFLIKDDNILLLRRFNTGYEDGNYSVPAGHLDGGEPVSAAAIREAGEECGISIRAEDLRPVGVMNRLTTDERIDFFFAVTRWSGEVVNREPNMCDDLSWHALDDLPENTIPYIRLAIENFRRGIWYSEFGWNRSQ